MTACRLPRNHRLHSTCRKRDIEVVFTPRIPLRLVEEWKVHEQGDRRIPGVVEHGATVPQEWKHQAFRGYMAGRKISMTMSCLIAHPSTLWALSSARRRGCFFVFKGHCIRKGCFVFVSERHFGKGCHNGEMLPGKRWCFHTKYLALSRFTCFRRPPDKNRRLVPTNYLAPSCTFPNL
jgi:hypothetical protein